MNLLGSYCEKIVNIIALHLFLLNPNFCNFQVRIFNISIRVIIISSSDYNSLVYKIFFGKCIYTFLCKSGWSQLVCRAATIYHPPHLISIAIGKHQKLVENIYPSIALSQNPKLSLRFVSLNFLVSSHVESKFLKT